MEALSVVIIGCTMALAWIIDGVAKVIQKEHEKTREALVAQTRAVREEHELTRRSIKANGSCPDQKMWKEYT